MRNSVLLAILLLGIAFCLTVNADKEANFAIASSDENHQIVEAEGESALRHKRSYYYGRRKRSYYYGRKRRDATGDVDAANPENDAEEDSGLRQKRSYYYGRKRRATPIEVDMVHPSIDGDSELRQKRHYYGYYYGGRK